MEGQTVDRCIQCAGLWLDESELGAIVCQMKSSSANSVPATSPGATSPATKSHAGADTDNLGCPKCEQSMTPSNYAHDSGIFVSRCMACDGTWLKAGQLERIASYRHGSPSIQRLGDAFEAEIRSANRVQFAQDLLRSRVLSSIVAIAYLVFLLANGGGVSAVFRLFVSLIVPLLCIWYPDVIGQLKGYSGGIGRPVITQTTPGNFVAICGWLLLLLPVIVAVLARVV